MIFFVFFLVMLIFIGTLAGDYVSERRVMRQGRILNAMKHFPYSDFMFREA